MSSESSHPTDPPKPNGTPTNSSGTPSGSNGTPSGSSGTPPKPSGTPSNSSGTPSGSSGTPPKPSGTPSNSSGTATGAGQRVPRKPEALKISAPKTGSVGLPAVKAAIDHLRKYTKTGDALRLTKAVNQKGGFDCPGCAWPDPDDDRSKLGEYCENGAKALAEEATKTRLDADFFAQHSVAELQTWSDFELGKSGRLSQPMQLKPGATHYKPISWTDAFDTIGKELIALESPDEALFYTSGRTSNEAAFLWQLFAREFGTNNLPDCSNMCHESSGVALSHTVGIGKGSVTLNDFYEAEVIIVMGQNPGTNHPRMLAALERCKENGGKIIAINPLPEAGLLQFTNPQRPGKILTGGTDLADLHLPVQINGDMGLLKAISKRLLELDSANRLEGGKIASIIDHDFIARFTENSQDFFADLETVDIDACLHSAGISRDDLETAVQMLATKQRIIICWAMGITQHQNGVATIQEIVNLLLLKGAIGIPGAGTCPVRGHSNVQGDRTMGVWEAPPPDFLDKLESHFGFKPPREHGLAVVPAIKAMHQGHATVFIAMGGNFLSATPDTDYTADALRNCTLTVQISTKLNRSHLVTGKTALILPCLGRTNIDQQASGEQMVSVENSMGVVHSSTGILAPCSNLLRSESAIVAGIARATLGTTSTVAWDSLIEDYDRIRDHIEAVIPGFENYNQRLRNPSGFVLPNGARERAFTTPSGKAQFTVNPLPELDIRPGEFRLSTIRSHDQFNTTIYGLDDRYRGIKNGRHVVFIHPDDLKQLGLKSGEKVDIQSRFREELRRVYDFTAVSYPTPRGSIAAYFPEANPLIPIDSVAEGSLTPTSKLVIVRLFPAEASS